MKPGKMPQDSFRGKLSARGQVAIPQALRQWAELREGTQLIFHPQPDGSILIQRGAPEHVGLGRLRGAWKDDASAIRERLSAVRQPGLDLLSREPKD